MHMARVVEHKRISKYVDDKRRLWFEICYASNAAISEY